MKFTFIYHRLNQYLHLLTEEGLVKEWYFPEARGEQEVRHLSAHSQDVEEATLFICKGNQFSPAYLVNAVPKGIFCYVSETKYDLGEVMPADGIPCGYIIVHDVRQAMAKLASTFYQDSWQQLRTIGITGTKGKSTTAYFMKYIMDEYLRKQRKPQSAILSGIDNFDGVISEESHLTTPEPIELHRHFYHARKSGIEYLSMEVSSQALKYHRTLGVLFDVGCFLNIGEDHISDIEHHDFEDYLQAKLQLFQQCKIACVNLDMDQAERILAASKQAPKVVTFGLQEKADIYGYDIVKEGKTISFTVRTAEFTKRFKLTIAGLFNVQNALAAIAMSTSLGIPTSCIYAGLEKARVSGRMEVYTGKRSKVCVIVDYAHNKMSFETLFESTKKEYPDKKITIVFGCPGKKALSRRRELGEIAGKYSNQVYLTEEDAGEESVDKICAEIAQHVEKHTRSYAIIPDREAAIREAISNADDDTVVLVTGKGRETRQKRGKLYIDTPSDVEMVKKYLEMS